MWGDWFNSLGSYGYWNVGLYGALVPYGSINLTVTDPAQAFVEPLTVTEVRTYLKLPLRSPSDAREDDELTALIIAARIQAEIGQGRDLVLKQWDLSHDYWFGPQIQLRGPLKSVDLFQYEDSSNVTTTMVQNTDYIVDKSKQPGVIMPPYNITWPVFTPRPSSAILVRFTSGFTNTDQYWAEAGALVKVGMKLLISHWFHNRIPFALGGAAFAEYPYAITNCLETGRIPRVI